MPAKKDQPTLPLKQLYFRIGEVAEAVGVKPYVLRYWESEFEQLAPEKSRMHQRVYSRKDVNLVTLIARLLHNERYTIEGARKVLAELKNDWAAGLAALDSDQPPVIHAANAGNNADNHDLEDAHKTLLKKYASLERSILKQDAEFKQLKSAHAQLTQELVQQRDAANQAQTRITELEALQARLQEELDQAVKPDPEFFRAIEAELKALIDLTEPPRHAGPAMQVD